MGECGGSTGECTNISFLRFPPLLIVGNRIKKHSFFLSFSLSFSLSLSLSLAPSLQFPHVTYWIERKNRQGEREEKKQRGDPWRRMRVPSGRTSLKRMQSLGGLLSSLEKETFRRRMGGSGKRFLFRRLQRRRRGTEARLWTNCDHGALPSAGRRYAGEVTIKLAITWITWSLNKTAGSCEARIHLSAMWLKIRVSCAYSSNYFVSSDISRCYDYTVHG